MGSVTLQPETRKRIRSGNKVNYPQRGRKLSTPAKIMLADGPGEWIPANQEIGRESRGFQSNAFTSRPRLDVTKKQSVLELLRYVDASLSAFASGYSELSAIAAVIQSDDLNATAKSIRPIGCETRPAELGTKRRNQEQQFQTLVLIDDRKRTRQQSKIVKDVRTPKYGVRPVVQIPPNPKG